MNTAANSTAIPPELYAQTMARSPAGDRDMAYAANRFMTTLNPAPAAAQNDRITPIQSLRRLDIMQHDGEASGARPRAFAWTRRLPSWAALSLLRRSSGGARLNWKLHFNYGVMHAVEVGRL